MNTKPVTISIPCPEKLVDTAEKAKVTTVKVAKSVAKHTGKVFSILKAVSSATKTAVEENYIS